MLAALLAKETSPPQEDADNEFRTGISSPQPAQRQLLAAKVITP